MRDAFCKDITSLWAARDRENPVPLIFSREQKLESMQKRRGIIEKELESVRNRGVELLKKMKMMGPKKRLKFARSPEFDEAKKRADFLEAELRHDYLFDRILSDKNSEIRYKKTLNRYLPLMSGEEFFEAQMEAVRSLIEQWYQDEERASRMRWALEDVLLDWAIKHGDDSPMVGVGKKVGGAEPIQGASGIENLGLAGKKLLQELHRIYDVIKKNPSSANLKHAQLLFGKFKK